MPRDTLQQRRCRATQMRRGDASRAARACAGDVESPEAYAGADGRGAAGSGGRREALARGYASGGSADYCAMNPPSAMSSAPVTYDDSSDARKSATLAISRGWAMRPRGIAVSNARRFAAVLM